MENNLMLSAALPSGTVALFSKNHQGGILDAIVCSNFACYSGDPRKAPWFETPIQSHPEEAGGDEREGKGTVEELHVKVRELEDRIRQLESERAVRPWTPIVPYVPPSPGTNPYAPYPWSNDDKIWIGTDGTSGPMWDGLNTTGNITFKKEQ